MKNSSALKSYSKKTVFPEQLVRTFHTALATAQIQSESSIDLNKLNDNAGFQVLLQAVQNLARTQGISEQKAAEALIETFRSLETTWKSYLLREGLEKLRTPH
jgi:hypothetical protein